MKNDSEIQRIKDTYDGYKRDSEKTARWGSRSQSAEEMRREGRVKIAELLTATGISPLSEKRILEIGCGAGHTITLLKEIGAEPGRITGIDLIEERVQHARTLHPAATLHVGNAENLPFGDASFELVTVFTVFTSILDDTTAVRVATEIGRVLAPGGHILFYDFRYDNPRNKQVRGITMRRLTELFPGYLVRKRTLTLLPPLARALGPFTKTLYPLLSSMPLLHTHFAAVLTKPEK